MVMKSVSAAVFAFLLASLVSFQVSADSSGSVPAGEPIVTIYHIEGRRSERIVWYCEEAGIPYDLKFKSGDLRASMQMAKEVNPLMPIFPTVVYGDEVLVESAAILQLLDERHGSGKLTPAHDSGDYPKYLQWLHFAEGSAAPRFITEFLLQRAITGETPPVVQSQLGKSDQVLVYLEDHLSRFPYFGGAEFSIADIMMHFNINFVSMVAKHDMTPYPKVMDWMKRVEGRPAFLKMREVSLPNGFIGVPG
ncbi:MAG: glutathione S-transferase family protein [Porticoccaceae bacterium]|nr:glutathione S-transferase family protein [Porticoccaceae bacterium]